MSLDLEALPIILLYSLVWRALSTQRTHQRGSMENGLKIEVITLLAIAHNSGYQTVLKTGFRQTVVRVWIFCKREGALTLLLTSNDAVRHGVARGHECPERVTATHSQRHIRSVQQPLGSS